MTEKVKVVTLGCEKNLVDSEIMSGLIHGRGFQLVDNKEDATVIIVNTCGFIDAAKEESVNTILDMAELKANSESQGAYRLGLFNTTLQKAIDGRNARD